jgi:hypothetical protein
MARQATAEDTQVRVVPGFMLAKYLETWARNLSYEGQAVTLLVQHGQWLHDHDFVAQCVYFVSDHEAAIDWLLIPEFLDHHTTPSRFDGQVLLLAQQLAGLRTSTRPRRRLTNSELEPGIAPLLDDALGPESARSLLGSLTAQ